MKKKTLLYFIFLIPSFIALSQYGPAGVGSNDGKSSLKLWLDADNGVFSDSLQKNNAVSNENVKCWKDLSGSNNHAYARADSTSPRLNTNLNSFNAHNSLRFYKEGTTNKRTFLKTNGFSKTNDITIYCVFNAASKAGGNNITPHKSQKYGDTMWYAGAGIIDGGASGFVNDFSLSFCDSSIAAGVGDSSTSTDYCLKTKASINQTYFTCMQKEAWSGILSLAHNNSITSTFKAGKQPINNPYSYFIGSNIGVDSKGNIQFFDGYIAHILIYNKILNDAEKIILENYLAAKYNLPLNSNDLFTFDNFSSGNYDFDLLGIGKADDGSSQLTAKGTGSLELSSFEEINKGEFLFISHNGKELSQVINDKPIGIKNKIERNWIVSKTGNIATFNLLIDIKKITSIDLDKLVLLIDTDNDGSFGNEVIGKGIISKFNVVGDKISFQNLNLANGNKFTFAELDIDCVSNCSTVFTPNGDGIDDTYYFKEEGRFDIFNRDGLLVKTIDGPTIWDGLNNNGEILHPGVYFAISDSNIQTIITLVK